LRDDYPTILTDNPGMSSNRGDFHQHVN